MTSKTRFYSRQVAEYLSTPHNIISIGEKNDGWQLKSCHTNVLRLLFDDVQEFLDDSYTMFSTEQAQSIIDWLSTIPEHSLVIVHCEGGVARSAAVVKFMVDKLGYTFEADCFCRGDYSLMNSFVYDILVAQYEAMEKSI